MRINPVHLALIVLTALMLTSCEDDQARAKVAGLELKVEALRKGMLFLVQKQDSAKRARLFTSSKDYTFIACEAGRLVVYCEGAEKYLDGHKIFLTIGNPFTATFSGFKLKVRYGPRPPVELATELSAREKTLEDTSWFESYNAWDKTLKSQETNFTEVLAPGSWTKVELILVPSRPEEVAYLELEIDTNSLSFKK